MKKKEILDMIANGETRKAINALAHAVRTLDEDLSIEIALQSARYEKYKKDERTGTQSFPDQEIKLNKINKALAEIAGRLPENIPVETNPGFLSGRFSRKSGRKKLLYGLLAVLLVSIIWIVGLKLQPGAVEVQQQSSSHADPVVMPPDSSAKSGKPSIANEKPTRSSVISGQDSPPPDVRKEESRKAPVVKFDTIEVILNKGSIVLIDGEAPTLVDGRNTFKKIYQIPLSARNISIVKGNIKCGPKPLKSLGNPINESNICN